MTASVSLRLWRGLSVAIVVAAFAVAGGLLVAERLFGLEPYVVVSDSMAPTLRRGDVVLVRDGRAAPAVGDIITFREPARGTLTHRVVGHTEDGGAFVTQGDANPAADTTAVPPGAVVGTVAWMVPMAGLPVLWAEDGAGSALELGAAAVVAVVAFAGTVSACGARRPRHPVCIVGAGAAPS